MKKRSTNDVDPMAALQTAVGEAETRLNEAQTALASHDADSATLKRELEISTAALDAATLAGDQRTIDDLVKQRGDLRERIESLERVRPHRVRLIEQAQAALRAALRERGQQEQAQLIAAKGELNVAITENARELAQLLEEAEHVQTGIARLAAEFGLDSPRGRLLLPRELIRSQGAEVLRAALDHARLYGLGGAGAVMPEGT